MIVFKLTEMTIQNILLNTILIVHCVLTIPLSTFRYLNGCILQSDLSIAIRKLSWNCSIKSVYNFYRVIIPTDLRITTISCQPQETFPLQSPPACTCLQINLIEKLKYGQIIQHYRPPSLWQKVI